MCYSGHLHVWKWAGASPASSGLTSGTSSKRGGEAAASAPRLRVVRIAVWGSPAPRRAVRSAVAGAALAAACNDWITGQQGVLTGSAVAVASNQCLSWFLQADKWLPVMRLLSQILVFQRLVLLVHGLVLQG